ncbi:MAG: thiol reductant ABC exporter subunit CydC [Propionibacteriaceae bacterium]
MRSGWQRLVADLLRSVPRGRLLLVVSVVLAAAASGASVALLGVSAWLISKAAEHPSFLDLSVAAVGVRFFGISRGVFRYTERLVGHDLALRMQSALRLRTYTTLARTTLIGRRHGDMLVRMVADVEAVQDVVVRVVLPFASAVVVMVGTVTMLARFSLGSAAVLLVTAVVAGLVLPAWAQLVSRDADAGAVPLRGELADQVRQTALVAVDLVAYDADDAALARLDDLDAQLRAAERRATAVRAWAAAGQVVAAGTAVLAALWIGGAAVASGDLAPRLLAVLVLTPLALHEVLGSLAQAAQTLTRAQAALERVVEVLEAEPVGRGDAPLGDASQHPSVRARDLSVGWPGSGPVLTGITFDVAAGESVAVVGPSGVGKTTLAATVLGLIPPVAGEVATTGRVGYLAQDAHLFATTVAENVRIGNKDASDQEVAAALDQAGLPLAPDRVVGELGATLSGGEARRLALSRLFAGSYDVLVLDEPTEHLDAPTADALLDDLWSRIGHRALLVVTHDERVVARCHKVVRLTPDPPTR